MAPQACWTGAKPRRRARGVGPAARASRGAAALLAASLLCGAALLLAGAPHGLVGVVADEHPEDMWGEQYGELDEDGNYFNYMDMEEEFHAHDFAPSHVMTFGVTAGVPVCFYDDIAAASASTPVKVRGAFFVSSGGSETILCKVTGPDDAVLYSRDETNEGIFALRTERAGTHEFCFRSDSGDKQVTFALHVGIKSSALAEQSHLAPISESVRRMEAMLARAQGSQNYMSHRVHQHLAVQEDTSRRVAWYTSVENVILVAVTLGQVYYIRSICSTRF